MTKIKLNKKVEFLVNELDKLYPDAECSLDYINAFQLLISTQLSAQCTDACVNKVTPALFEKYPDAKAFANAELEDIEKYIYATGFYHNKAKNIKSCCIMLCDKFNGDVPHTMEELTMLAGVGRKTANLVLGDAFNIPSIVVDTHCIRLSGRLGLTKNTDPNKIESDLRIIIPPDKSNKFCHALVLHGRAVCTAKKPKCDKCTLKNNCNYYENL